MWNLGLLGAAGGIATGSYELLSTVILGDNSSTQVQFISNQEWDSYDYLQLRASARIQYSGSPTGGNIAVYLNGTTSNYANQFLRASGTNNVISGVESGPYINRIPYTTATNQFGSFILDLADINNTSKLSTYRTSGGSALSYANWIDVGSGGYFSSDQVTSIEIKAREYTLGSGSRFSLYGIRGS